MTSEFIAQFWEERAAEYAAQTPESRATHVREHPGPGGHPEFLYTWSPGSGGAFGGRRFVVTMDDGRVLGPGSNLWSRGRIPEDMLDRFPPNARIAYAGTDRQGASC